MPIPVIDPTVSIQAWVKGYYNSYQAAATNSPTAWDAEGLPDGVAINDSGLIQGIPTVNGIFNVKLIATNASGDSAPIFMALGVEVNPLEGGSGIELNIELETGFVRGVYAENAAFAMYAKSGDKLPILVGFTKAGVLQPLALGLLRFHIKEFDSEEGIALNGGAEFEVLGSYDTTRYRILADFDNATLAAWLSNYEEDEETYFRALGEIEAVVIEQAIGDPEETVECPRSSQTFRIFMEREKIPNAA